VPPSPVIGRPEIWEALRREREKARAGVGRLTLLEGASGLGKSTFLAAAVAEAEEAGFRTVRVRASAHEDPPPFALVREISAGLRAAHAGAAPSSHREDPDLSEPPSAEPELAAQQLRLAATLSEPLFAAARSRPVLIAIDDLHRADPASIDFFLTLLGAIAERPIWVLGTLEPSDRRAEIDATFSRALAHATGMRRLALRPLTEPELDAFLAWAAPHRRFRPAERRHLFSVSEGIPSFLLQLVRYAPSASPVAGEEVTTEPEAPPLDETTRRVLDVAVVLGNEFPIETLAAASEMDEEAIIERVERLVEIGLLTERESGRFAFREEESRYRLYSALVAPRLRVLHARVARSLERLGEPDAAGLYALARHTYAGRLDERAIEYNRRAALFAAESFQAEVALVHLGRALEALERSRPNDRRTALEIRLEIASQRARAGDAPEALEALAALRADGALWSAAEPPEKARFAVTRSRLLADIGQWEAAEDALDEVGDCVQSGAPPGLCIAALRIRGEIRFFRGDYAGSLAAHEAARALAESVHATREWGAESIRRATALSMLPDRKAEAAPEYRAAVEKLVECGDLSEAAFGLLCLGAHFEQEEHPDEARRALTEAIDLAERAHDLRRLAWARLNFADLELAGGRANAAETHNREALQLFERLRDSLGLARAFLTAGRLAAARGEPAAARQAYDEAKRTFAELNLKVDELEVELRQAEADLALGDPERARRAYESLRSGGIDRLRPDLKDEFARLGARLGEAPAAAA
jgi:hypothetical protein